MKKQHFTLVELLVVVAVLASLASLLLPALRSAIESGWQVRCASNQRQVATAVNTYFMDWPDLYAWSDHYVSWTSSWSNKNCYGQIAHGSIFGGRYDWGPPFVRKPAWGPGHPWDLPATGYFSYLGDEHWSKVVTDPGATLPSPLTGNLQTMQYYRPYFTYFSYHALAFGEVVNGIPQYEPWTAHRRSSSPSQALVAGCAQYAPTGPSGNETWGGSAYPGNAHRSPAWVERPNAVHVFGTYYPLYYRGRNQVYLDGSCRWLSPPAFGGLTATVNWQGVVLIIK